MERVGVFILALSETIHLQLYDPADIFKSLGITLLVQNDTGNNVTLQKRHGFPLG